MRTNGRRLVPKNDVETIVAIAVLARAWQMAYYLRGHKADCDHLIEWESRPCSCGFDATCEKLQGLGRAPVELWAEALWEKGRTCSLAADDLALPMWRTRDAMRAIASPPDVPGATAVLREVVRHVVDLCADAAAGPLAEDSPEVDGTEVGSGVGWNSKARNRVLALVGARGPTGALAADLEVLDRLVDEALRGGRA